MTRNNYRKTYFGMITRMYYYLNRRVTKDINRRHKAYKGLKVMKKEDFYTMAIKNKTLQRLYTSWKAHKYSLRYRPTPDRINSKKGYLRGNIRFVTYSINSRYAGKKNGK